MTFRRTSSSDAGCSRVGPALFAPLTFAGRDARESYGATFQALTSGCGISFSACQATALAAIPHPTLALQPCAYLRVSLIEMNY